MYFGNDKVGPRGCCMGPGRRGRRGGAEGGSRLEGSHCMTDVSI